MKDLYFLLLKEVIKSKLRNLLIKKESIKSAKNLFIILYMN